MIDYSLSGILIMSNIKISNLKFFNRGPYNFEVGGGKIACVFGQSGAGKSLLLRAIADLDPSEGQVLLNDIDFRSIPANEWRSLLRYVPAESQWWRETVGEHYHNLEAASKLFVQFGFDSDVANWKIHRLSTGEKQRLALVRALMDSPSALLLDEPTASLDEKNIEIVEKNLVEYIETKNIPAIWVSHDMKQISRIADFRVEIENGGNMGVIR